ncbi:MAG: single-stranded-DNA-specific exonuclease RecJ [Pseudomonadota bacterium]
MTSRLRPLKRRDISAHALDSLDPVIANVLAARGVSTLDALATDLSRLAPVSGLLGIDDAVALLSTHRDGHVLIVGDFDADGATSTALMWRCLKRLGFRSVASLVPNRFDFGYGLSAPLVEVALREQPTLIVTVDNGISSVAGVAEARAAGVDVLVTDHHLPPATMPAANVIVNPNLPDDTYPSKHLAGVGVAFCIMAALARALSKGDPEISRMPAEYLDLVALGTVADVVPLDQNNRILVAAGLARIRAGQCVPGITALLEVAGRDCRRIVATDLGFAAGPRLNAAGRLDDMAVGIRCLMAEDAGTARKLAGTLDKINKDRREIESEMQAEADNIVRALDDDDETSLPSCLCLYEPHWHQGVVGLVASRVKERTGRPTFAFAAESDGLIKGSGRSVNGVHLRDLLAAIDQQMPGAIAKFGGHAMAAGLTMQVTAFDAFARNANDALALLFPDADFNPALLTDGALSAAHWTIEFAQQLKMLVPWGQRFPEPIFDGIFTVRGVRVVGEDHLKLTVASDSMAIDAIAFRQVREPLPVPGEQVELCYRLDVNHWQGRTSLQLLVEQWRVVSS